MGAGEGTESGAGAGGGGGGGGGRGGGGGGGCKWSADGVFRSKIPCTSAPCLMSSVTLSDCPVAQAKCSKLHP